jgi:hypothetical protein
MATGDSTTMLLVTPAVNQFTVNLLKKPRSAKKEPGPIHHSINVKNSVKTVIGSCFSGTCAIEKMFQEIASA